MGLSSAFDYGFLISTILLLNSFRVFGKLRLLIGSLLSLLDLVHLVEYAEQERCAASKAAVVQMIKATMPVVEFGCFLGGLDEESANEREGTVCAVCLCCVERGQEVRELCNCQHVFHKRCLDEWMDQLQETCPLCRSNLLPHWACNLEVDDSSWLVDRISYLLGEDLLSKLD